MAIQFVTDQITDDAITADKIELDTGAYAFAAGATLTWAKTPAADTELANKAYVDSIAQGLHWKDSVVCATTGNGVLASAYENGDAVDGVTLATNDRILIKDQTAGAENGIYIVQASGAPQRAADMNAGGEFVGAAMFVREGTVNADSGFVCTNDTEVNPDTTVVTFTQFTGAGQVVAGEALSKTGNTLNVEVDDSSIGISSDELHVKALGVTNAMLAGSIVNGKLANSSVSFGGVSVALGATDATPAFDLSDATAYPTSSLVGTITNAQLAGSIANDKLAAITTAGLVSVGAIDIDGATEMSAALADADLLIVDDGGAGTEKSMLASRIPTYVFSKVAGGDVLIDAAGDATIQATSVTDAMLAGSISNGKLSNSSVSLGGISVALGGTDATPAFNLADATNYPTSSLVGSITNSQLAGSIANGKLANSSMTVTDGSNSTAISLGGTLTFDAASFVESSGTILIKASSIDFSMLKPVPVMEQNTTTNGSLKAFALANNITSAAWLDACMVFRNGQLCKLVAANPGDSSEYTIASSAGTTTVTFGEAPGANELLTFNYMKE